MTGKEYLQKVATVNIDQERVTEIQEKYGKELPPFLKQLVSAATQTEFLDGEKRILSFSEMLDADEDLHVDFPGLGLFPVADFGDNDFVVYHLEEGSWSLFHIIDECVYKKRKSLEELL